MRRKKTPTTPGDPQQWYARHPRLPVATRKRYVYSSQSESDYSPQFLLIQSSEYETDSGEEESSEEEPPRPVYRPTFVPK